MVKIKTISVLLLIVCAPLLSFSESELLWLSDDRVIEIEWSGNWHKQGPALVLLPGVNRGIRVDEEACQYLTSRGLPVASFNLSVQPLSLRHLSPQQRPQFMSQRLDLESLSLEAIEVVRFLAKKFNKPVREISPVSLSYSGAISSRLKSKSIIIDVVPMTSSRAVHPELEQTRDWLKSSEILNPVWGPAITRSTLDLSYRSAWQGQVDRITKQFQLSTEQRELFIQGYSILSRATEGFEWDLDELDLTPRIFVVAENDSKALLRHQLKTVQSMFKKNRPVVLVYVRSSGHVIPSDQPKVYSEILFRSVSGLLDPNKISVVDARSEGDFLLFDREAGLKTLEYWISQL